MKRTKRRFGPIVLLAFSWLLIGETGCQSGQAGDVLPSLSPSGGLPPAAGDDETVATVGGHAITRREVVDQLLDSYGPQTLRTLMLRMAADQEADAKGISITDEQVTEELRRRSEGYGSEEAFYDSIRQQLGMDREEARRDAKYRLELEGLAIASVDVSDGEIDRYVREHEAEFGPHTKLRISHIVVSRESEAESLLGELEGGSPFEDLARQSVDAFTSESGGDLGWLDSDDPLTDSALLEAANALDVGETTGPVETGSGYELVKLTGRSVEPGLNAEEARREARKQLALDKAVPMAELEQELLDKYGAEILDPKLKPAE